MESAHYTQRTDLAQRKYEAEYKLWYTLQPAAEKARLKALGLDKPSRDSSGEGHEAPNGDRQALEAYHAPAPAEVDEHAADARVANALREMMGEILSARDARLTSECLGLITGVGYLGLSETAIAAKHGLTRAAVSKRCVELLGKLGLKPSRAMRDAEACEAYSQAQLKSKRKGKA